MILELETVRYSDRAARAVAPNTVLERVGTGFVFTEGPLWDPRTDSLYFSDIPADRIYRWREGAEAEVFRQPSGKSNGLTWDRTGRLIACEHRNRRVSRTEADGTVSVLTERYGGARLNSPNDVIVHSSGAFYFTDPPYGIESPHVGEPGEREQPVNGLYLLRPGESEPLLLADDFDRPNGLALSPDETTLYVADTPRLHLRAFTVQADGTLDQGRLLVQFHEEQGVGRPDGLKVDVEGRVYATGPGGVWLVEPDGQVLAHLRFPERTANCAWGDADWSTLYVTATSSVYRIRTLVPGIPAYAAG